jgi:cation diffusion facilitator CzcD-associated flavoprotein CzcO
MPTKEQSVEYFTNYTKHFGVHNRIHLNSKVTEIQQNDDQSWTVKFEGKPDRTFDFLVMATGVFSKPRMPKVEGLDKFKGHLVHSQQLRDLDTHFKGKDVVILGGGKSAQDISRFAAEWNASSVTMIARRVTWSLAADSKENDLFGFIPLPLFVFSRISEPFKIAEPQNPQYAKFQKTWLGRKLHNLIWRRVSKDQLKGLPDVLNPAPRLVIDDLQSNGVARDFKFVDYVKKGKINILRG